MKADLLWDTMVLLFGIPVSTDERGRRNKRVKELKEIQAVLGLDEEEMAAELRRRYGVAMQVWPTKMVTENSIVSYWSRFNALPTADEPADWTLDAAAAKRKEL